MAHRAISSNGGKARRSLDAFIRSLNEADGGGVDPPDDAEWANLTSREHARLAKLFECRNELFPPGGETPDRIVPFWCPRARHKCRARVRHADPVDGRCHFGLTKKVLRKLKAEFARTKRVPNPHRRGCYYFIIEALKALGINRRHSFDALRAKVETLMGSNNWRVFACRGNLRHRPRVVEDVEADANARLHCNCRVLQRKRDYGLKLLQVGQKIMRTNGCVIDIVFRAGQFTYRLNTNADCPQYEAAPDTRRGRRARTA